MPAQHTQLLPLIMFAAVLVSASPTSGQEVTETQYSNLAPVKGPIVDAKSTLAVGKLKLPADGNWEVKSSSHETSELYLTPQTTLAVKRIGRRMLRAEKDKQTQQGQWILNTVYWEARKYARDHQGRGPAKIDDLKNSNEYLIKNWGRSPYSSRQLAAYRDGQLDGPFRFLIPNVEFDFVTEEGNRRADFQVLEANRKPLAIELRPYVEDGKHWVIYTDGQRERREPDPALLEKYDLAIRPVLTKDMIAAENAPVIEHHVVMVCSELPDEPIKITLHNPILREERKVSWNLRNAQVLPTGDDDLQKSLLNSRKYAWRPMIETGGGAILETWLSAKPEARNNQPRRTTSAFSVLGGRAAIEETLQMQNLIAATAQGEAKVAIADIAGVEVKSHPFEKMLRGNPGGRLPLANFTPHDRFFLYVGQPSAIVPLMDSGAGFIADAGAIATGNRLEYQLAKRYLGRLGLDQNLVRTLLQSEVMEEFTVSAPDLLLIDGTDITIVARVRQAGLLSTLIGLSEGAVHKRGTANGDAYWSLQGDVLIASTAESELKSVLDLIENDGEGSLGQSAEFRYMLTKLPVERDTQFYAYFSDPFIRRLVGPEVKLKQRRRLIAKAQLERTTALGLLSKLQDGDATSIDYLAKADLIPKTWADDLSIDSDGRVASEQWGTLERMRTLQQVELTHVTESEHQAYQNYVNNYSRFWRQFFDPIAIRLSKSEDQEYELTTFILPLIDSSIYEGLRSFVAHADGGKTLRVPTIEPRPVMNLSLNLREDAWTNIAAEFSTFFSTYSGVSPAILDDLGNGVHLAIHDADPVLVVGSGDVLGAFGSDLTTANEMMALPVIMSVLTRPCTILIETQNPEQTARYLRLSASGGGGTRDSRWFQSAFYQIEDRDQWAWTVDMLGMAKLRFGVEVKGDFLVIRNIPWNKDEEIVSAEKAQLNGAELVVHPGACDLQLPSLYAAAADTNRQSVLSSLARLYPILLAHPELSVEQAIEKHRQLFGFAPKKHATDAWHWDGQVVRSRDFGIANQPKQPAYNPEKPFGLLQRIDSAKLNMQFEDDGLRSQIMWTVRPKQDTTSN